MLNKMSLSEKSYIRDFKTMPKICSGGQGVQCGCWYIMVLFQARNIFILKLKFSPETAFILHFQKNVTHLIGIRQCNHVHSNWWLVC